MKHFIDAPPGSEEFKARFRAIRDQFISSFQQKATANGVETYHVSGSDGKPVEWISSQEDTARFMASMFDDGFMVAFAGFSVNDQVEVYATYWEEPDDRPKWPCELKPHFEEVHEGVFRSTS